MGQRRGFSGSSICSEYMSSVTEQKRKQPKTRDFCTDISMNLRFSPLWHGRSLKLSVVWFSDMTDINLIFFFFFCMTAAKVWSEPSWYHLVVWKYCRPLTGQRQSTLVGVNNSNSAVTHTVTHLLLLLSHLKVCHKLWNKLWRLCWCAEMAHAACDSWLSLLGSCMNWFKQADWLELSSLKLLLLKTQSFLY